MTTRSFAPRDGALVGVAEDTTVDELFAIVDRATAAAPTLAGVAPAERRGWLDAIATAVEAHADELVEVADTETALGAARLRSEVARVAAQLRFYGQVAADGGYLGVTIDPATATSPRLVRVNRPLGPVAVFGSSNFPFAFGVLGNDTASALAAGCPVVAKAHSAHLLTCLRLAEIARDALHDAGAPRDALSIVVGRETGARLVAVPGIKAVGFTGSQAVGLTLWRIANDRPEVIPVYAEMGTVNPVVLTAAAAPRLEEIAAGFVSSFTLGAGQFCTKPGLMFTPAGLRTAEAVAAALSAAELSTTMLTAAIADSVRTGCDELVAAGATIGARVRGTGQGWSAGAAVLTAPLSALKAGSRLLEEVFGPVAVVVEYADQVELTAGIRALQPSLTAAVFGGGPEDPDIPPVVATLAEKVGRVTVGDWPTGVAWTWAQQHGGPWPATSAPAATSVGAAALSRFVRPVAFQSVPDEALPTPERTATAASNPWRVPRRIDGRVVAP
ncbi:aldehyde dehydrogenase family protein [Agromyces sp. NPDC058484]|uniref:aldehyde dehydrogenase family protein n=1 Tax=Agromyces sp. NPDC058484 TaxID=3346524 RepID=UPI0036689B2C